MSTDNQPSADPVAKLSPRERCVTEAVWSDVPFKTIGQALGISAGTVRTYLDRVRLKLGVTTRVAVALRWERHLVYVKTRTQKQRHARRTVKE